jgi:hypothetical protein
VDPLHTGWDAFQAVPPERNGGVAGVCAEFDLPSGEFTCAIAIETPADRSALPDDCRDLIRRGPALLSVSMWRRGTIVGSRRRVVLRRSAAQAQQIRPGAHTGIRRSA